MRVRWLRQDAISTGASCRCTFTSATKYGCSRCASGLFDGSAGARALLAGGAFLGLGFYTHPTAVLTMPTLAVLTCVAAQFGGSVPARVAIAPAVGFALLLLIHVPWYLRYPSS